MENTSPALIPSLLVSEDDPVLKRFYQQALETLCEECIVVDSSLKAMELLSGRQFDFLITDLKLSEKDGLDIINCAVQNNPQISILVASGYVTDSKYHDELVQVSNVKGVLQKPFTIEVLHQKIKAIIGDPGNRPS